MIKGYIAQILGSWISTPLSLIILQLVGQGDNSSILNLLYWNSFIASISLITNESLAIFSAKNPTLNLKNIQIINFLFIFIYIFLAEIQFQKIYSLSLPILLNLSFISFCVALVIYLNFLSAKLFNIYILKKEISTSKSFIFGCVPVWIYQITFLIIGIKPQFFVEDFIISLIFIIPSIATYIYICCLKKSNINLFDEGKKIINLNNKFYFKYLSVVLIVIFASWSASELKLLFAYKMNEFSNITFVAFNIVNTSLALMLRINYLKSKKSLYSHAPKTIFKSLNKCIYMTIFTSITVFLYLNTNIFNYFVNIILFFLLTISISLIVSSFRHFLSRKIKI